MTSSTAAPSPPEPEAGASGEPGYTPDPDEVPTDQAAATLTTAEELRREHVPGAGGGRNGTE
jgi:hypothetical protein